MSPGVGVVVDDGFTMNVGPGHPAFADVETYTR
jgi:hypothetical protein